MPLDLASVRLVVGLGVDLVVDDSSDLAGLSNCSVHPDPLVPLWAEEQKGCGPPPVRVACSTEDKNACHPSTPSATLDPVDDCPASTIQRV